MTYAGIYKIKSNKKKSLASANWLNRIALRVVIIIITERVGERERAVAKTPLDDIKLSPLWKTLVAAAAAG